MNKSLATLLLTIIQFSFLTTVTGAISSDNAITATPLPVVVAGVTLEEAKRNTLLFIIAMTLFMLALVGVGYWKQKSTGKTPQMVWTALLLTAFNVIVLSNPLRISAFCPVCTIAVGAGLGFAKSLGIDDVITSIWIGGLMVSMTMWLINWLDKKKIRFLFRKPLIVLLMYGLVIIPFVNSKTIGANGNTLWGMDKVVLGMLLGTIAFITGYFLNNFIMRSHNDKGYFPFQKVVLPISMMIILSLVFYFIVY